MSLEVPRGYGLSRQHGTRDLLSLLPPEDRRVILEKAKQHEMQLKVDGQKKKIWTGKGK